MMLVAECAAAARRSGCHATCASFPVRNMYRGLAVRYSDFSGAPKPAKGVTRHVGRISTRRCGALVCVGGQKRRLSTTLAEVAAAEKAVLDALLLVEDPVLKQNIVALRYVQNLVVDPRARTVSATLRLPMLAHPAAAEMAQACEAAAKAALQTPPPASSQPHHQPPSHTATSPPGVWTAAIAVAARRPLGRTPAAARYPALAGVEHIVAVSSCKGGVGKSTVAVNLAYALAAAGARVGLLDADVYGPSLPTMISPADATLRPSDKPAVRPPPLPKSGDLVEGTSSLSQSPFAATPPQPLVGTKATTGAPAGVETAVAAAGTAAAGNAAGSSSLSGVLPLLAPVRHAGVACMSFGWVSARSGVPGAGGRGAAVLRGPMVSKVVNQLVLGTDWGELDILVVDMPPGTGDIQITLCQTLQLSGAVVVTTPQLLAYVDVVKGVEMFAGLGVPALAAVENMAYFDCDHGTRYRPFGAGHLARLLADFAVPYGFELPLSAAMSAGSDTGAPLALARPEAPESRVYGRLAAAVVSELLVRSGAAAGGRGGGAGGAANRVAGAAEEGKPLPDIRFVVGRGLVLRYLSETDAAEFVVDPAVLRRRDGHGRPLAGAEAVAAEAAVAAGGAAVRPTNLVVKGNYGVGIDWADGRRGDIYPYDILRRLADERRGGGGGSGGGGEGGSADGRNDAGGGGGGVAA